MKNQTLVLEMKKLIGTAYMLVYAYNFLTCVIEFQTSQLNKEKNNLIARLKSRGRFLIIV